MPIGRGLIGEGVLQLGRGAQGRYGVVERAQGLIPAQFHEPAGPGFDTLGRDGRELGRQA